jgi:hypothetical protein
MRIGIDKFLNMLAPSFFHLIVSSQPSLPLVQIDLLLPHGVSVLLFDLGSL